MCDSKKIEHSVMCNFFASPFEYNIQITRKEIISWEKWIFSGIAP